MKLPKDCRQNSSAVSYQLSDVRCRASNSGLALLELLTVLGIAIILFGFGYLAAFDFYQSYALASETDILLSIFRSTRSRALTNLNQAPHGILVTSTQYIIYQGPSYANRSSTWDQIFERTPGVSVACPGELTFSQLAATSSASTTFYLFDNRRLAGQDTQLSLVKSGSYAGNGADNRAITGVGFQPDTVIIKGDTSQVAVARLSSMIGDSSKLLVGSAALTPDIIQSLDADGFTIGTHATVNSSGANYHWIAFKAEAELLKIGSYTGDGTTNHPITGLGFSPDYIMIMSASTPEAVHRSITMPRTYFFNAEDGDNPINRIKSFDTDGFTVGNSSRINTGGFTYYYAAWNAACGKVSVGSYAGDNTDNRSISGAWFKPEYVIIRGEGLVETAHKSSSTGSAADVTMDFRTSPNDSNEIQALEWGGFQVGNDPQTNSSTIYHWVGFNSQARLPNFQIKINYEGRISR